VWTGYGDRDRPEKFRKHLIYHYILCNMLVSKNASTQCVGAFRFRE
jgi:hypothetical protein